MQGIKSAGMQGWESEDFTGGLFNGETTTNGFHRMARRTFVHAGATTGRAERVKRSEDEMILCAWRDLSWLRADVSRLSLSISLSLSTVKFSIIPKVIQGAGIDSLVSKEFNHFDRCVNR